MLSIDVSDIIVPAWVLGPVNYRDWMQKGFVGATYGSFRKEEPDPAGVFDDYFIDVGGRRVNG